MCRGRPGVDREDLSPQHLRGRRRHVGLWIGFLDSGPATSDTVVTLTSSNTGEATVTQQVTIPQRQQWATFTVTAVPGAAAPQSVTVTASSTGLADGSASVNVVATLPEDDSTPCSACTRNWLTQRRAVDQEGLRRALTVERPQVRHPMPDLQVLPRIAVDILSGLPGDLSDLVRLRSRKVMTSTRHRN